jgi:hypothetical protein
MQNPDNIYLVLCILGAILIGSNLLMYGIVRGSRGMNFDWFKEFGKTARQPWSKEDDGLTELARQADKIRSEKIGDEKPAEKNG